MRGLWSSSGSNFCLAALAVRILFVVSVPTQFFVPIRVGILILVPLLDMYAAPEARGPPQKPLAQKEKLTNSK